MIKKELDSHEVLVVEYLLTNYQVPRKLAERYAKMLVTHFTLQGIENHIDAAVLAEDLYQETEDWETPDYMPENVKDLVNLKLPFPNLDHSEKKNAEEIGKLRSILKDIRKMK